MKSILLIEASRLLRFTSERALAKAGYRVVSTRDLGLGLRFAHHQRPDLILLDNAGPEADQFSAGLQTLKRDPATAQVPVLVLSSQGDDQSSDSAVAYLEKSDLDLHSYPHAVVDAVQKVFAHELSDHAELVCA